MMRGLGLGLFAAMAGVWLGMAGWYFWSYVRPARGGYRRPQTLILASACMGWGAFILLVRGWLPHWGIIVAESVCLVASFLVLACVYLYESVRPRTR